MAELERVAVEVHGYNEDTQHMVMNQTQLNMHYYMLNWQLDRLKETMEEAYKDGTMAEPVIPVFCELDLIDDPTIDGVKKDIPIFTEFNLNADGNEYRALTYAEAAEARRQLEFRKNDLEAQISEEKYKELAEKMHDAVYGNEKKGIEGALEHNAKVFGTTEGEVAFKSDLRHVAEIINTQAQILYGADLDPNMLTYATKSGANQLVKMSYMMDKQIEAGEKVFGIRPTDKNIEVKVQGIDAYGQKFDTAFKVRDELVDKAARAGRSIGSVVENVVDYGEKAAEKINDSMYKNFVHNLTVAMSYSDKMVDIAERHLPHDEFVKAQETAKQMRFDRGEKKAEKDEKLEKYFNKAADTIKTPFNIAVGMGCVIDQQLGISEHLKKAQSYAKGAFSAVKKHLGLAKEKISEKVDDALRAVDAAFDKVIDTVTAIPHNVQQGFNKFASDLRKGGSNVVQAFKQFNEIGAEAMSNAPSEAEKKLAREFIKLNVGLSGTEIDLTSKRISREYDKAVTLAAKLIKLDPQTLTDSLNDIVVKTASLDIEGFKNSHGEAFNRVLEASKECGFKAAKDVNEVIDKLSNEIADRQAMSDAEKSLVDIKTPESRLNKETHKFEASIER